MINIPEGDFTGYIFDCDGTLADTMPLHYRAWAHAYKIHGAKFNFTWELLYSYAGTGLHDSVLLLNERFGDSLDPHAVVDTQIAYVDEYHHLVKPIIPVLDFARNVATHSAISVASGGTRRHVHETLRFIDATELFPVVVTKEDVKRSKPAPDTFILAAEKMGVAPEKCLVLEDSHLGIEAADAAGMASVFIDPSETTQPDTSQSN